MKRFTLKIIWLSSTLGLAVDHVIHGGLSPLSSYFFWPRNDAWAQIRSELKSKPWISDDDTIELLNQATLIIEHWQKYKTTQSALEVQKTFPEIIFYEL